MSAPHASFIYLWINSMLEDYQIDRWAYISGEIPSKLVHRYMGTGIIHVEPARLHYPNWQQLNLLIGPYIYDWSKNYGVHLWYRLWDKNTTLPGWAVDINAESIKTMNTTLGQIARMIYYGFTEFL